MPARVLACRFSNDRRIHTFLNQNRSRFAAHEMDFLFHCGLSHDSVGSDKVLPVKF